MPIVFPLVVKVTGPVSVPAVDPETVAFRVTALPNGIVVGLAVIAVVVVWVPDATMVSVTLEAVDPVYVLSPEYVAETVCVPAVAKSVLYVAMNGAEPEMATGVCADPSRKKVTVPVGFTDTVFGATVAVNVTASLIASAVPGLAVRVVLVPVAVASAATAVARLLASTVPIPVVWS